MNLLDDTAATPKKHRLFAQAHKINTFIFDLDGTLLNDQHELSDITISTLHELRARQHNVVIATGRHYQDIQCYLQQLGGGIAAITCNGANIHDTSGSLIHREGLPPEVNELLISLGDDFKVHTNVYTDLEWLVSKPCESMLEAHQASQFFYRQINRTELLSASALKILFYGENSLLQALHQQLQSEQTIPLNVTFSDANYLEVMRDSISKGDALKILLASLQLPQNQTMAFGDSMNDAELLSTVAHPIVMENANPALKALLPNAHRAQHHHQDGVARFLREHVL